MTYGVYKYSASGRSLAHIKEALLEAFKEARYQEAGQAYFENLSFTFTLCGAATKPTLTWSLKVPSYSDSAASASDLAGRIHQQLLSQDTANLICP